jgi:hypothetical protein
MSTMLSHFFSVRGFLLLRIAVGTKAPYMLSSVIFKRLSKADRWSGNPGQCLVMLLSGKPRSND